MTLTQLVTWRASADQMNLGDGCARHSMCLLRIRAVQGHSGGRGKNWDSMGQYAVLPEEVKVVFHGTTPGNMASCFRSSGLIPGGPSRTRDYIHLAAVDASAAHTNLMIQAKGIRHVPTSERAGVRLDVHGAIEPAAIGDGRGAVVEGPDSDARHWQGGWWGRLRSGDAP